MGSTVHQKLLFPALLNFLGHKCLSFEGGLKTDTDTLLMKSSQVP